MSINRRDLLLTSGFFLLAGKRAFTQSAAPASPQTQTSPQARLLEALRGPRLPLTMNGGPGGRGWDWLVKEARGARFTLIGEEHGVAETAHITAALFKALHHSVYNRMSFELSPIVGQHIWAAARRCRHWGARTHFAHP